MIPKSGYRQQHVRLVPTADSRTAANTPCLFDHLVGEGEQLVWDLETTMLTHARLLSYASDSDDVEFRVFLANLECSLKVGRIEPTL